mmetsp:Transcript_85194/g.227749  ORF Transcript_85194/g.227749 Transcript_85194/m.227749 type:complete len:683 (-) Transcript_85194:28-2076(-)
MKVVLALTCVASASTVTPTQKVIQLLQGMMAKGKEEKQAEEVRFSKFKQWCENTDSEKSKAIAKEKATIEELDAEIGVLNADVESLAKEIASLDKDVDTYKTDIKAATEVRGQERSDYSATHQDYSESLDALDRAIQTLKKMAADVPQSQESLLQVQQVAGKLLPEHARRVLAAFLQSARAGDIHNQAPEANAYEFQGGGIIDMLEDLKNKFRSERSDLEKEELNQKHDYEMMVQTLNDEIEGAEKERSRKAESKSNKQKRSAEAVGEKADEEADLAADSKYLSDLTSECTVKSKDFEQRQKLRGEEIEAIGQAIDILASPDVSGAADKHLPSLLQKGKSHSFAQLRSVAKSPNQEKVALYLQQVAAQLGSTVLAQAAEHAEADPFKKVAKMIKNLIIKLKEEANEEAEHTGWCNTELTTNKQTRERKTADVENLHSEIEEMKASNAKLSLEIGELQDDISALEKAMAKATEDRAAEKEKNKATIADAQAAQEAVANALQVLKDFYDKAKEATALTQGVSEDAPETFSEPYKGQQGESGGVLGMLEVIQSDFARLETDTKAAEAEGKEEYEQYMGDSKTDKAVKQTDIKNKSDKVTRQAESLSQLEEELGGTQKELDAAMDYYDKLKPSCVSAGVNYDDRVKQREEEIQSLKEALKILRGEDVPMPIESGRPEYETGASFQE